MFSALSQHLASSLDKLRGIGRLTQTKMTATLTAVRHALLEADVALSVIDPFFERVRAKASEAKILGNIRPGDALIKLVQDELTEVLGSSLAEINLNAPAPLVIVVAGLQGSGKTTTVAKLAYWLKQQKQKSVMLSSTDIYRPAALDQLHTLAQQIDVPCLPVDPKDKPTNIVRDAIQKAKTQYVDVLIIDTAGRLHIDRDMMNEIKVVTEIARPTETLLVVDSMTGQDAAQQAKHFNDQIALTGIILTKVDGDARGGAALSMRMITGKPIKLMGTGEKIEALEPFHPARIASRILGMGDVVSLVETARAQIDQKKTAAIAKKIKKGQRFDFNDFLDQLQQIKKMGDIKSILSKLPMTARIPQAASAMMDERLIPKMEAIIQSMTLKERQFPALLNGSRKRRIARGSGTSVQDVNSLLKQFTQMQKVLKRFKGKKMRSHMKQMTEAQLPPELLETFDKDRP